MQNTPIFCANKWIYLFSIDSPLLVPRKIIISSYFGHSYIVILLRLIHLAYSYILYFSLLFKERSSNIFLQSEIEFFGFPESCLEIFPNPSKTKEKSWMGLGLFLTYIMMLEGVKKTLHRCNLSPKEDLIHQRKFMSTLYNVHYVIFKKKRKIYAIFKLLGSSCYSVCVSD